jgi:hypothetical protein
VTRPFALAIVVEAEDAEEAHRFTHNMLCEGTRWDRPLEVSFVGEGCEIGPAEHYATEEIHLLRDGMRVIAVPEPSK